MIKGISSILSLFTSTGLTTFKQSILHFRGLLQCFSIHPLLLTLVRRTFSVPQNPILCQILVIFWCTVRYINEVRMLNVLQYSYRYTVTYKHTMFWTPGRIGCKLKKQNEAEYIPSSRLRGFQISIFLLQNNNNRVSSTKYKNI